MTPELGLDRDENADGLERRRGVAVGLDADRRDVVLNGRVVAGPVAGGSRPANRRRHVPMHQAVRPPRRDARECLPGRHDMPANGTAGACMRFAHGRGIRCGDGQQTGRQHAQCCDDRA